jgi:hypothetical protein
VLSLSCWARAWHDIEIKVFLDEVLEFGPVDQRDPVASGEFLAGSAESGGGDQDSSGGVVVGHDAG